MLLPVTSAVAPLEHEPGTLVLCFDDTAFPFQTNCSNVLKLLSLLHNDESHKVYYHPGVGNRVVPGPGIWRSLIRHRILQRVGKILDESFAWYLCQDVMDCYEWLVQYFNPGDNVYVFGFSRGAYIARVVAAMLHKVGLVSRDKLDNENEEILHKTSLAYDLYVSTNPGDEAIVSDFKKQYSCPIRIEFLGVWDTVPSVGFLRSKTLPFVDANASIRVFRQALSLDEHRSRFRPNLFRHAGDSEGIFHTDVKEVWFAGSHSDVGGGSVSNTAQHDLADISLRWMIEQLVRSRCQIVFNYENFAWRNVPTTIGQDQPVSPPQGVPSISMDVDELNAHDAVQPINDELFKNPLWWILEILPTSYTFQNMQGKLVTTFEPHFGRGRRLPPGPLFHTSVKTRMDDLDLAYKPRAWYEHGTENYVS